MTAAPRVLVIGRQAGVLPPGLPEGETGASYAFAEDMAAVRDQLPGTEIVFHFGEPREALAEHWDLASELRWVHVAGVGVDWVLSPELTDSHVTLTNAHGVFDTSLPEYLVTLMLALLKDVPGTVRAQAAREWRHRLQEPLAGSRAVLVGAGSIGRSAAAMLRTLGVEVVLVGRREREGRAGEGRIRAITDLPALLPDADWLILITPLTDETHRLIGAHELALLPSTARVVNIGRGPVLHEAALIEALRSRALAGAALDVFEQEPLPADSPLWALPNVLVSPHVGGDVADTMQRFTDGFLANLRRYLAGEPLQHVVDKRLGFIPPTD